MKLKSTLAFALLISLTTHAAQFVKEDWKFPAPGIKGRYDKELKGTIYDLGEGFSAHRADIKGFQIAIVVFRRIPDGIEDSDAALAIAYKVLKLQKNLEDVFVERVDEHEHLFRTASGRVAGVTLAHDRKSAIVRLLPLEMM